MRYYIVDVNGTVHGDTDNKPMAEAMLADIVTKLKGDGVDVEALELEIVEDN